MKLVKKIFPTWVEIKKRDKDLDQETMLDLIYKHELIFDEKYSCVYFLSKSVNLSKQEYKFLLKILKLKGTPIKPKELLKKINSESGAKPEDFIYKLKSRIKAKLKKDYLKTCPAPDEIDWIIFDENYANNHDNEQKVDFEKCFGMLIKIQNGAITTNFKQG